MIDLSIIIVNWNTRELLRQCLDSVYATVHGLAFEVWVVDNDSTDGSVEMVRISFPQVKLVVNMENLGFARANNQVLAVCQGHYILLLNSDTHAFDNSIEAMVGFLDSHPGVGAVGPQLINADGSLQESWAKFPTLISELLLLTGVRRGFRESATHTPAAGPVEMPLPVDWVAGASLMIRSEVYSSIGGFDPDYFMYSEETDWCWRMWRAGFEIWFLPDVRIIHYGGASTKQQSIQNYIYLYNSKRLFFAKNYGRPAAFWFHFFVRSLNAGKICLLGMMKALHISNNQDSINIKLRREIALWNSL